jgi:predicted regulator of Ras-like GTPase activity (Roadblock/LC7/MglB family)
MIQAEALMFQEVLKDVVDRTEGGIAGLVMGFDGIPVDSYVKPGEASMQVETVGQEYSVILKEIRRAAEMLDAGEAREVAIQAERLVTVIRLINEEYFVALALKPGGNVGKARFLLRTGASKLAADLTI